MKFETYATFEVMHGRKSTTEELISLLSVAIRGNRSYIYAQ